MGTQEIAGVPTARRGPIRLRFDQRLEQPRWLSRISPILLMGLALLVGGVLLSAVGVSPFVAYPRIFRAAFGTPAGWLRGELYPLSDTTVKATPGWGWRWHFGCGCGTSAPKVSC
jgi:hypothetical protein